MDARQSRTNRTLLLKLLPVVALLVFVLPSSAFGQATRTWVSGVGDDVNPCSRTAPCKTFPGAISKTAAGGEINVLDPGAYGAVTITKSMTIDAGKMEAGVLATLGSNAIVVNAGANDKVKLRGLDINGAGTGLNGVKVISAARVSVKDSEIYGFELGVNVNPSSASGTRVVLKNNHIHDDAIGVFNGPASNTSPFTVVTMNRNDVEDTLCGAVTSAFGATGSPTATTDCGASGSGSGINRPAVIEAYHNHFNDNNAGTVNGTAGPGVGLLARGGSANIDIAWNVITGNTVAMRRLDGAAIRTFTPATNVVSNNGSVGDAPNASTPLVRPGY